MPSKKKGRRISVDMNARTWAIVSSVVALHLLALWALHQGLLRRVAEVVVPAMLVSTTQPPPEVKPTPKPEPPPPEVKPPPPKPEPPPPEVKPPPPKQEPPPEVKPPPKQEPPPKPVSTPVPPPAAPPQTAPAAPEVLATPKAAPAAPAVVTTPTPAPPPAPAVAPPAPAVALPVPAPVAVAPSAPAPPPAPAPVPAPVPAPAAAKVELPSSKADYLHNPTPDYPRMSVRLGEQGQVVVKVLIGTDGVPQKVELHTSSGFARLDKSALDAAMRWRYVPGKRGGVAETMWYQVPITFNLKKE